MGAFGLFKEPKNIIELFTFDLTTFFYEEDYEEINCDEKDGVFMIEYEKKLPWLELDLFEKVIFRVFNDKTNIVGSSHINIRFPVETIEPTPDKIKKIINTLHHIYGYDDDNIGEWNSSDEKAFNCKTLNRQWTLGEGKHIYSVKLSNKDNLILEILFFNHLLELIKN